MSLVLKYTYVNRLLRALSYSARWVGTEKSLKVAAATNIVRSRLLSTRIIYRTGLFAYQPKITIQNCTKDWIYAADTLHLLSSRIRNFNTYCSISHTSPYQFIVISGALAKIGSSTYKIFFYNISICSKFRHSLLLIRKIYFLYFKATGHVHSTFHLTLLTLSLISELAIDAKKQS